MRPVKTFAFVVLATFVAVACGKGPAQAALTAADSAVASARADGEKFAPDQFNTLAGSVAAAHAKFDSGDYKGALEGAQAAPAQAQAVMQAAGAKKTELMDTWKALEGSLPTMVADVQKKVMELASAKKLPAGLDKAGLDGAKTSLEAATAAWAEAGDAFKAGDMMAAVAKAQQVKAMVGELMTKLGLMPAVAEAPAMPATEPAKN